MDSRGPLNWRAYFELLRLPAVFTAIADVMMGYLVTHGDLRPVRQSGLLVAASALMYLAGMVLNDVVDLDVDAIDRPQRPIPSGRVLLPSAKWLGWSLLIGGCLLAWLLSSLASAWRPAVIGTSLAAFVVLYDLVLKRTPIAQLAMGGCRFFNVLLGMSLAATADPSVLRPWTTPEWLIATGIGVYVVGITMFARTEARESSPLRLAEGILVMAGGTMILATGAIGVGNPSRYRWLIWTVIAAYIVIRHGLTLIAADSRAVQNSVRHALRTLIFLDFVVAFEAAPHSSGCMLILLLYVPMLGLEYRFSTT